MAQHMRMRLDLYFRRLGRPFDHPRERLKREAKDAGTLTPFVFTSERSRPAPGPEIRASP
jgi:hypothetical protein